jgi:hypothetical protein
MPHICGVEDDYANTRTNPLFDSKASPTSSPSAVAITTSSIGEDAARWE